MAVIGVCAAVLVCFIVIYSSINGSFSPKENTVLLQNTANQTSDEIYEQSTYEYDVNPTFPETDYAVNVKTNDTSDSVIYSMPIEQGTSSTGFITDATTQSANVYNSNGNNFDTYSNLEQQQTNDSYVLNTNPERMKIHYPTCNDVAKIAPENYSTSNLSVSELQSQGYSTCGHCFK